MASRISHDGQTARLQLLADVFRTQPVGMGERSWDQPLGEAASAVHLT